MSTAQMETTALNYVGGDWRRSGSSEYYEVFNPATSEVLARAMATIFR